MAVYFAVLVFPAQSLAELKPRTLEAFNRYVREAETAMAPQFGGAGTFTWASASPEREAQLRKGQIVISQMTGDEIKVPDGLIHDWIGAAFIPGATIQQTLVLVQDYGNHQNLYKPEVISGRVLQQDGNHYRIHLRLLKKKIITVVLDTEHDVHYFPVDVNRWHSRSYTSRISEVEDAGTAKEKILPPGEGHGFLWKLNSYWKFHQKDGGVYVECRSISLTRDVPTGLGWIVEPVIRDLPRESLDRSLRGTRDAVQLMIKRAGAGITSTSQ